MSGLLAELSQRQRRRGDAEAGAERDRWRTLGSVGETPRNGTADAPAPESHSPHSTFPLPHLTPTNPPALKATPATQPPLGRALALLCLCLCLCLARPRRSYRTNPVTANPTNATPAAIRA